MSLPVRAGLILSVLLIPFSSPAAQNLETGFMAPQAFGAGGAVYVSMISIDLPDIDSRLTAMGLDPLSDWITLRGGGGSINAGEFWIGGYSVGGTVEMSAVTGGILREARLDLSQGGVSIGYLKAFGRMKLTLGGTVGLGRLDLHLVRRPEAAGTWNSAWQYYDTGFSGTVDATSLATSTAISGKYFLLEPSINLRYWFMPVFAIDLGATYQLATIGAGKLKENGQAITGSPELGLSGMGMRIGLYIGF